MSARSPETVLAEWRAAQLDPRGRRSDPGLQQRIGRLRREHAAALLARHAEAAFGPDPWGDASDAVVHRAVSPRR